jgi:phosphonate transport system ATP-binding protein
MVRLEGVGVSYPGGVQGLKPTSLVFHKGEFTVLLGASGAGKSTMLRCVNGLVPVSTGTIVADRLGTVTPGTVLRRHRRRTAMIFQQHQLNGRLSDLKNVMTGRLGYYSAWHSLWPLPTADRRLCLDCIERVGLLPHALRRADQLSGGQQQRVGIARALAQKPSLILADEPVASLDPETARNVLTLLYDICRTDGISAIVSLHQLELARDFADRIVGIADGAVVFDGPPDDLSSETVKRIYRQRADTADTPAKGFDAVSPAPAYA